MKSLLFVLAVTLCACATPTSPRECPETVLNEPVVLTPIEVELPPAPKPTVAATPPLLSIGIDQIVLSGPLHPDGLVLPWAQTDDVQMETLARLRAALLRVRDAHPGHYELVIRAADDVAYGDVTAVMDVARVDAEGQRLFDHIVFAVPPQ